MKFIHAADIHLDSPLKGLERYEGAPVEAVRQASRRAFENLVSLACSEQVDFVIIAGDLFDGDWKDYNTGLYFVKQMSRLNDAGIPVYIAKGNHDAANKLTKSLPLPENVHVFSHQKAETFLLAEKNVAIHGQSFGTADLKDDISLDYPLPLPGKFNIGVLHTCASGREGHDSYAPCRLDALVSKGYQYWALGHVHKREVLHSDPPVIFPGNIQGRHIRETGEKGCFLISVDDRHSITEEFCELCVMRWELLSVDLSECKHEDEVFQRTREAISNLLLATNRVPLAIRVILCGKTILDSQLRCRRQYFVESIRSLALQSGLDSLWIEKVKIQTLSPQADSLDHFDGPLAELINLISESRENNESLLQLQDELQELRSRLPSDLAELKLLNSNDFVKTCLNDAEQILLDRLSPPGALK